MTFEKKHIVKSLMAVALALTAGHLGITLRQDFPQSTVNPYPANENAYRMGVEENAMGAYRRFSEGVDSLLIHDYAIRQTWIRNELVHFDRGVYSRKQVRIPPDFAITLFNIDLKSLAESGGWGIYDAQENMKTGDLSVYLGREGKVYQVIQLLVSGGLQHTGKNISILVAGFGLTYDELTRSFIEFPEPITLIVPPGQEYSAIIAHEARRNGKPVIFRVPERKNILKFETSMVYDSNAVSRFYSLIQQTPNGGGILFYEKKNALDLLTAELPKLPKRGIYIKPYTKN